MAGDVRTPALVIAATAAALAGWFWLRPALRERSLAAPQPTPGVSSRAAERPCDAEPAFMRILDERVFDDAIVARLANATMPLTVSPLSEAEFGALSPDAQQRLYDRTAAFRELARSIFRAAEREDGRSIDPGVARALLERLASDNSDASLATYLQMNGAFAAELLERLAATAPKPSAPAGSADGR
ncbi:MAG TPA: hypothetical protein PKC43_01035 [Phycisphaerales bacterium]|nr:hypothetical protein [Phycisphaerales bacterium]HMP36010.1 hypothetical protein [Phycisphaerales bacterium]